MWYVGKVGDTKENKSSSRRLMGEAAGMYLYNKQLKNLSAGDESEGDFVQLYVSWLVRDFQRSIQ